MAESETSPAIVIIGAGVSGLCLAIRLKLAGIESFTILEKSEDLGGVWRDNTYPGAGCDIPAFLYSYSFAPKLDWKRRYASQSEILEYFRNCAERFGIMPHTRFGVSVTACEFDEESSTWRIHTVDGRSRIANILVSAVGQLSQPRLPRFEGLDAFSGAAFHSARWDHDFTIDGRDFAVIGNAASAVQFLPHLAERAHRVFVFQRSPNWISRLPDRPYPPSTRWTFRKCPGAARLHRWSLFCRYESRILLNGKSTILNRFFTRWLKWRMSRRIPRDLRPQLVPEYAAGCKRILLSNDYLETVQRPNVEIVTDPIERITSDAVETGSGSRRVDGIIFATGFESGRFLAPIGIRGRSGRDLHQAWSSRPRAYLGMMSPEFPNFFMLYGPGTNLTHNSIIFMVECQVNYLLRCLEKMTADRAATIEINANAAERYDRRLQKVLQTTVWTGDCENWYKNEDGTVVNNWSSSTLSYWLKTRRPDFRDFRVTRAPNSES